MSIVVGTASYSNGEQQFFTDPKEFIKTVHEELPDRGSSGFMFKVMAADPETRKAIDDIVIGEFGDTNEHEIAYYQNSDAEHKEKALEDLNTALYEKMYAEQETYRSWLLSQPPEEILKHTYEYTVREDILLSLEYNDLSMEQASALLVSKAPLDDVFQDFEKIETDHMAIVQDCVSSRADINQSIRLSRHELVLADGHFYMVETGKAPVIETPKLNVRSIPYVQGLRERCNDDLMAGNYDSVITKSRTMIEEILVQILEENKSSEIAKGDLNKLYNQVKVLYGMQQSKDFDGRVNSLLSGLEKIVQAVAEMRNANSDAHGVGSRRIVIRESEARLVMNSAITFCEYMISGHGKCK